MPEKRFERVLEELRGRVAGLKPWPAGQSQDDAMARALHELDVSHAEIMIQNQDLLETQAALAAARDRYRELFDEAPSPILSLSSTGIVHEANLAALRLLGRERDGLAGKPFVVCLAEGEPELYFRHLSAVSASRVAQTVELAVRDGVNEPRRVLFRTALLPGRPSSMLCHLTDVSAQRAAALAQEKLERRLREGEKLEAIGRVAANIAHEVNNILVSVISLAEFARDEAGPGPIAQDLDSLLDAAWRGARLMRGLLGLSRGATSVLRVFDLGRVVAQVASMLRHKKQGIEVSVDLGGDPMPILGDEDELLQALLNVGTNGLEAMTQGRLSLSCALHGPVSPGEPRLARVRIKDEGVGMTDEQAARAFEPLFTTKAARGGSGLGLSLVRKTVLGHHGTVDIDSSPGRGTTLTIELPVERDGAGRSPPLEPAPGSLSMTVLLVDDDDFVRVATRRHLEALGATILDYADGLSAFEATLQGKSFDVALLDVNMPGCSGPELARRLFDRQGPVPVVFVTGAAGDIPAALLELPHVRFIRKPWTRRELAQALRDVAASVDRLPWPPVSSPPEFQVVPLLQETNAALLALLESLEHRDWGRPTVHPTRDVKDLTAHLLDGSLRRLSFQRDGFVLPAPPMSSFEDMVGFVQHLNTEWMAAARRLSPRLLIELLRWADGELVELFRRQNPGAPAPFGVAWAGEEWSENGFDMAREYTEKWHHQQQLRDAVGKPGLREARFVRPVLDTFLRGAPHAYRDLDAPEGTEVRVDLDGEGGGSWSLTRENGRWGLAPGGASPAAVVRLPVDTAWRLWTRGLTPEAARERAQLEGQAALGAPLLKMVTVMA